MDKKQWSYVSTPPYARIQRDDFTFLLQINTEYFSEKR